ncbi:BglG family transcription antiterminator [Staphylococcus lutrae]|uniref:Transcription antiterminator BglG n=1 Tax=Staphylococcus lutrae TaxID=155085 RepID=A0AAC9RS66_9STAP|nr:PRD domain-containing protein [Staphylococcus lutrae]ARJ50726.1 transcription antiterminator BglG [Staphylococcus lutrae]PNZ34775.1 PRD domain-containing protein [Staphylococcus lutrae]
MLTNRQYEILDKVIKAKGFVSIAELAKVFERTERTIQYDIEYIEWMAQTLNLHIQRSKSNGIKIDCEDMSAIQEMNKATFPEVHLTKSERHLHLLLHLFEAKQPVNSKMMARLVNVSRRTIVDDLKEIGEWLSAQDLALKYVKNKGFVIRGTENCYRKAYSLKIHEYIKTTNTLVRKTLFVEEEMPFVRQLVLHALEAHQYPLFQMAIDGLVIHILIAIQRIKKQFTFNARLDGISEITDTAAYPVALLIQEKIEQHYQFEFPPSETLFIALHLLGAKKLKIDHDDAGTKELKILIHQFVEKLSANFGIDLIKDTQLLNSLFLHLTPALNRLTYQFVQHNPIKNEIYTNYPELTEVITRYSWIFEELYQVTFTEDEIAYLTLHVASSIERLAQHKERKIKIVLLCGSGIGTSQLLKERMHKIYPEFDILDAYSLYQIDEAQLKARYVDYVVTTVPIQLKAIECIEVTPFLNKRDREKLNDVINQQREQFVAHLTQQGPALKDVLKPAHIIKVKRKMNRNEAIAASIEPLEQNKIVTEKYKDEIINKLDEFGPYMAISPHIALIHGGTRQVLNGVGMTLLYFEVGVPFQHTHFDPIKVIIGLATDGPQKHLTAMKVLSDLLMDDTIRNQLLSGDLDAFIQQLNNNA